jgi:hypothetical protein
MKISKTYDKDGHVDGFDVAHPTFESFSEMEDEIDALMDFYESIKSND